MTLELCKVVLGWSFYFDQLSCRISRTTKGFKWFLKLFWLVWSCAIIFQEATGLIWVFEHSSRCIVLHTEPSLESNIGGWRARWVWLTVTDLSHVIRQCSSLRLHWPSLIVWPCHLQVMLGRNSWPAIWTVLIQHELSPFICIAWHVITSPDILRLFMSYHDLSRQDQLWPVLTQKDLFRPNMASPDLRRPLMICLTLSWPLLNYNDMSWPYIK